MSDTGRRIKSGFSVRSIQTGLSCSLIQIPLSVKAAQLHARCKILSLISSNYIPTHKHCAIEMQCIFVLTLQDKKFSCSNRAPESFCSVFTTTSLNMKLSSFYIQYAQQSIGQTVSRVGLFLSDFSMHLV